MKQFFTILALTATVAVAQQDKCSKLQCADPLTSVTDAGQTKNCTCLCKFENGTACPAGEEKSAAGCECVTSDPCAGQTCDDKEDPARWMMDAECACVPAAGEDPCDAVYAGAFTQEDGTDCPAGDMEGEAGAVAQTASLALAVVAALLF